MKVAVPAASSSAVCLCAILCWGQPPAFISSDSSTVSPLNVERLIRELGAKRFADRQRATRQLIEREDGGAALEQATQSSDLEVARLAAQVLRERQTRANERAFERLKSYLKAGMVDQALEWFICRPDWDTELECWEQFGKFAAGLRQRAQKHWGGDLIPPSDESVCFPFDDFRKYVALYHPEMVAQPHFILDHRFRNKGHACMARAHDITLVRFGGDRAMLISSGDLRGKEAAGCLIFAGGSVIVGRCTYAVIIAAGDVTIEGGIHGSLIVSRGNVSSQNVLKSCVLAGKSAPHAPEKGLLASISRKNQLIPLEFVRFFDPTQAGIEVLAHAKGVRVKAVADKKRFALAGLKPDDVLLAIDKTDITSTEQFRRLLRRKLAEEKVSLFQLVRGGKPMEIRISMKD